MKTQYTCQNCGTVHSKWQGQCSGCRQWNTLSEEQTTKKKEHKRYVKNKPVTPITQVRSQEMPRIFSGIPELDCVLGGGLVPGSFVLLSGDPGIGKSTLLTQTLHTLACRGYKVLYASGEESQEQIHLRAQRLGTLHDNILLSNETCVEDIISSCQSHAPMLLVVDSIQTVFTSELPTSPGSVGQVRESCAKLLDIAKSRDITVILIGHVTKDGAVAGPKILEHLVDTVLYLEGDVGSGYRILRSIKNRFGSTGEIGVFSMQNTGLQSVANPSALFLEGHRSGLEGSAVGVSLEGSRPLLGEVQALVGKSNYAIPKRTVTGLDNNRFAILCAVLEKRAGLFLSQNDIYAQMAGGLKISEPAMDLPLAAAISSSLLSRPHQGLYCFFGEVGLSGEIRTVSNTLARVQEAQRMGFTHIYLPAKNYSQEKESLKKFLQEQEKPAEVIPIEHVQEVVMPGDL